MDSKVDRLADAILKELTQAKEPLATKEVEERLAKAGRAATRTKIFYRLMNLRGEGLIKGKFVGPGKGVWIWWRPEVFPERRPER